MDGEGRHTVVRHQWCQRVHLARAGVVVGRRGDIGRESGYRRNKVHDIDHERCYGRCGAGIARHFEGHENVDRSTNLRAIVGGVGERYSSTRILPQFDDATIGRQTISIGTAHIGNEQCWVDFSRAIGS